jgi:hypothetical protein
MARTCLNCGGKAIDDQSQFCNKCGTPFPKDEQRTVVVRTTPRLADTSPPLRQPLPPLPPPVAEPPAPQYRAPPVIPAVTPAAPPRVRVPARRPVQKQSSASMALPFRKLIAKDFIRPMYWIGVIAILLVVFSGMTTSTAKTPAALTSPDAGTDTATKASGDILAGIPLFWIGVMVFANLLWRTVCETSAVQFALYDATNAQQQTRNTDHDFLFENEVPEHGDTGTGDYVECPRCGKVVASDELRSCAHCGVEGCTSCIRMMGLVRKTLTCRDCYEKK